MELYIVKNLRDNFRRYLGVDPSTVYRINYLKGNIAAENEKEAIEIAIKRLLAQAEENGDECMVINGNELVKYDSQGNIIEHDYDFYAEHDD